MIFYFSGTGNAQDVATRLAGGEPLYNIAECMRKEPQEQFPVPISGEERCGIVFPVYYGNPPQLVRSFLERLRFSEQPSYLYLVLVYSFDPYQAADVSAEILRENSDGTCRPDAVFRIRMPENYVIERELEPEGTVTKILQDSIRTVSRIRTAVDAGKTTVSEEDREYMEPVGERLLPDAESIRLREVYDRMRMTEHFSVSYTCIGCSACANRCPVDAIVMQNGVPSWQKRKCTLCMACARCGAILYDNSITGKKRYTHPMLRKKKCH